jgi:hypothetical protein
MACVHEWEAAPVRTGKLLSPWLRRPSRNPDSRKVCALTDPVNKLTRPRDSRRRLNTGTEQIGTRRRAYTTAVHRYTDETASTGQEAYTRTAG